MRDGKGDPAVALTIPHAVKTPGLLAFVLLKK